MYKNACGIQTLNPQYMTADHEMAELKSAGLLLFHILS